MGRPCSTEQPPGRPQPTPVCALSLQDLPQQHALQQHIERMWSGLSLTALAGFCVKTLVNYITLVLWCFSAVCRVGRQIQVWRSRCTSRTCSSRQHNLLPARQRLLLLLWRAAQMLPDHISSSRRVNKRGSRPAATVSSRPAAIVRQPAGCSNSSHLGYVLQDSRTC
jgi:hypothetical protein